MSRLLPSSPRSAQAATALLGQLVAQRASTRTLEPVHRPTYARDCTPEAISCADYGTRQTDPGRSELTDPLRRVPFGPLR